MGKDSLLESTSKKKAAAKGEKEKPAKKKTAAKKPTGTKSSAKSKPPAKAKKSTAKKPKKAAAASKSAAKKTAKTKANATKAKKTASKTAAPKKTAARKPTRKELLWKQFEGYPVDTLFSPQEDTQAVAVPEAPSFFSGMSDADARKAKEYLTRQFDWAEIKAAGEQYAATLAAKEKEAKRKAEEEAQRKAEQEARRKAEEEAQRKAEQEARRKAEEEAQRKADKQMPPPPGESESHGGGGFNPIKIGIVVFCAIILLLVVSSYSNTKNYYIQEKDGAVEIWRGTFAPMGKTRLMILPGIQMPSEAKEVYGWQDAYRLMYQYYIEKADAILDVPGVPDTAALTANLEKAIQYAPNRELRDKARSRLISLRMQTLVHKAQAALNRGTIESAEAAIEYLNEAAQYELSPAEAEMIEAKIEAAEAVRAEREMAQAEADKAAAEEAALEEEARALEEAADNQPAAAEEGAH